jgi:hypothetical protein
VKRNAKQNGSGGRLRFGLLLATAAAFLLAPASQALGAPPPQFKLNIIAEPGASGEVISIEPNEGTPPIACNYPVGGPQEEPGCENEMEAIENPITHEIVAWRVSLNTTSLLGPETKVKKWELLSGEVRSLCGPGNSKCTVETKDENEDVEVNLYLENETTELRLNLIGEEGGGGEVVSPWALFPIPGSPEIECWLPEAEGVAEQEGVCENEMEFAGEGPEFGKEWGETLEALTHTAAHPAPNSELEKWEFKTWFPLGECEPVASNACIAGSLGFGEEYGEDVEIDVYFTCEAGKECPEGPAGPPLTLNVEEGSGTVVSNPAGLECTKAAPEGCVTEEVAEGQVTLTASPAAGYLFKSWKGCDKTNLPEAGNGVVGRKCTLTLNAARTVGVKFIPAHSLAVTKVGPTAGGAVSTSPGGVNCGATCVSSTALYKEGALTLKQKKAKHFHFVEFKGGTGSATVCNGVETETCAIPSFTEDSTIEAQFAEDAKATLAYSAEGGGQGSVKTKPTGINCGYTCTAAAAEFYEAEGEIEVIVKLNKGTGSVEWTTGAGTCTGKVETAESTCKVPAGTETLVAKFE